LELRIEIPVKFSKGKSNMKGAVLVIAVLLLSGCGGSQIDGTYCDRNRIGCFTFRSNGTVLMSVAGMEVEMKYEVDGDKIQLMDRQGNRSVVLTMMKDGSIEGSPAGKLTIQ
jgi:hypothetical protein